MIVSYHPCFEADRNVICAGRAPNDEDREIIRAADAVILPQGCRRSLYRLARAHCRHVFPNYDARFEWPGKIGQIQLFRRTGVPHPETKVFASTAEYLSSMRLSGSERRNQFPCVFKFDWGGEGETVHLVRKPADLRHLLMQAVQYEKTGQKGFLIQEYVPNQGRTLRVVVIGRKVLSYWRIQPHPQKFHANLSQGAVIDPAADPHLRARAAGRLRIFLAHTRIDLAGFDFLFSLQAPQPLFLEINYFFGRKGLGGSQRFYELLHSEIHRWLQQRGLALMRSTRPCL